VYPGLYSFFYATTVWQTTVISLGKISELHSSSYTQFSGGLASLLNWRYISVVLHHYKCVSFVSSILGFSVNGVTHQFYQQQRQQHTLYYQSRGTFSYKNKITETENYVNSPKLLDSLSSWVKLNSLNKKVGRL